MDDLFERTDEERRKLRAMERYLHNERKMKEALSKPGNNEFILSPAREQYYISPAIEQKNNTEVFNSAVNQNNDNSQKKDLKLASKATELAFALGEHYSPPPAKALVSNLGLVANASFSVREILSETDEKKRNKAFVESVGGVLGGVLGAPLGPIGMAMASMLGSEVAGLAYDFVVDNYKPANYDSYEIMGDGSYYPSQEIIERSPEGDITYYESGEGIYQSSDTGAGEKIDYALYERIGDGLHYPSQEIIERSPEGDITYYESGEGIYQSSDTGAGEKIDYALYERIGDGSYYPSQEITERSPEGDITYYESGEGIYQSSDVAPSQIFEKGMEKLRGLSHVIDAPFRYYNPSIDGMEKSVSENKGPNNTMVGQNLTVNVTINSQADVSGIAEEVVRRIVSEVGGVMQNRDRYSYGVA